jgi:flagellar motor protein MotB
MWQIIQALLGKYYALSLSLLLSGCVLKQNHDSVVAQSLTCQSSLQALTKEKEQLAKKLEETEKLKDDAESRNEELARTNQMLASKNSEFSKRSVDVQQEILKMKQEGDEKAKRSGIQQKKLIEDFSKALASELKQGIVSVTPADGKVAIDLSHSATFTRDSDEISATGKKTLRKIADLLERNKGFDASVGSYTDSAPTNAILKKKYPTAWEFSAGRALKVARFLEEADIEESRLSAVGYGPSRPSAGNIRGVEISVLLP